MRQSGYYWVRIHSADSEWEIAYWYEELAHFIQGRYPVKLLFEINETRILNPDECAAS